MTEREFKIREMRERAGMNQQQVADALHIKKARYGDWERETTILNLKDAIALANLFSCTLDELAGRNTSHLNKSHSLTHDEQSIVDGYRAADARQRERLLDDALREIRMAEEDAREKKEVI